jgi:vacuolar-type H+-ATPase subunit H
MRKLLPVDLYVPDLDVPSEESLYFSVNVTGVPNVDSWVRGLEDVLADIDEKYSKKERKGGKRISLGCAKVAIDKTEIRLRIARFIPYPQSIVNRVKRLRSEAYDAIKPYVIVQESPSGRKKHFMSGDMLIDAKKAIMDLNERVVHKEIQTAITEFENSSDYARIFDYIKNSGVAVEEPGSRSFPEVSLDADQLGILSESYRRLLNEKKRLAIEAADAKRRELVEKIEQEAEKKRQEVLEAIEKDIRGRLTEVVLKLGELTVNDSKTNRKSLDSLSKRASELHRLASSVGLGEIISDHIKTIEKTAQGLVAGDANAILEASKKFAESCGVSPTEVADENFRLAAKKMRGESLFLRVID